MNHTRTKTSATGRGKRTDSGKAAAVADSPPKRSSRAAVPVENPKLTELKRRFFPEAGRAARIERARKALIEIDRIAASFKLDKDTLRWLAEDPDLEYL